VSIHLKSIYKNGRGCRLTIFFRSPRGTKRAGIHIARRQTFLASLTRISTPQRDER
jgi:hypothetical protein